jgi:hypothetical protein
LRKCKQVITSHSYFPCKAILKISQADVLKGLEGVAPSESFLFILTSPSLECCWGGGVPPAAAKGICKRECETIYRVLSNKREAVTCL